VASTSDTRWTRGVSYARFSTDRQESTEEQHDINAELAAEAGIKLVERFTDDAESRTMRNRSAFMKMLAYLSDHREVGWVVVGVSDRLIAGLQQAADWERFTEEYDVRLKTKQGEFLPHNGEHQVTAAQNAVSALAEVVKIRERTRTQLRAKVRAGTVAMRPAYGVRMKPLLLPDGKPFPSGAVAVDAKGRRRRSGELEVHPDELPWVIQMFEWVGRDGLSMDEVARQLTLAGVPTKRAGAAWRASSVRGILGNPFYKGQMSWGAQKTVHMSTGKVLVRREPGDPGRVDLPSPLGALVDADLWQRVQDVLAGAAGARPHDKRQRNPRRAFDGLVACARCGSKMYGLNTNKPRKDRTRRDVWRYVCYGPRPGSQQVDGYGPPCRTGHSILEGSIIDELAKLAADPSQSDILVRYVQPADQDRERRRLTKRLQELDARFKRERELARNGLYTIEEALSLKREHDDAVALVQAELDSLRVCGNEPRSFTIEAAAALAGVVDLLRDRSLPGDVLAAGLRDMGLTRVFVNHPRVELEWRA